MKSLFSSSPRSLREANGVSASDVAKALLGFTALYRAARTNAQRAALQSRLASRVAYVNQLEQRWERRAGGDTKVILPGDGTARRIAQICGYPMDVWYTLPTPTGSLDVTGESRHDRHGEHRAQLRTASPQSVSHSRRVARNGAAALPPPRGGEDAISTKEASTC